MGNKQSVSTTTEVRPNPRCVHRGCTLPAFPSFVLCLDHIKAAKQKEIDDEKKQNNLSQ